MFEFEMKNLPRNLIIWVSITLNIFFAIRIIFKMNCDDKKLIQLKTGKIKFFIRFGYLIRPIN